MPLQYQDKIEQLVYLIKQAGKVLALTGAGVSTESGIPDFRSRNTGLWNEFEPAEVASIQALKKTPPSFYRFNLQWWKGCLVAKPNAAHHALAELERAGWLLGVITQNIDGLHQAAGSTRVWEVHGNLRSCYCLSCCTEYEISRLFQDFFCDHCNGLLRPRVVLFDDPMPRDYYTAQKVMSGCQLLLIIGSSLQVQPVASLPDLSRQVVIINREPTPRDETAELVFREPASQVLGDLARALKDLQGPYFQGK